MKEPRRKKPTPLGWAIAAIILAVFILVLFLWIYPHIKEEPIGTITRIVVLMIILAVVLGVVRALGGKRLIRE